MRDRKEVDQRWIRSTPVSDKNEIIGTLETDQSKTKDR